MLLIVAIIAVLVFISIPLVGDHLEKARVATDSANERGAFGCAVAQYLIDGTFAGKPVESFSEAAHTSVRMMADMPVRLADRSGGLPEIVTLSADHSDGMAASPDADEGIELLAANYTPVDNVGIYPNKTPDDFTYNTKVNWAIRRSGQTFDLMVGQKDSFLYEVPTKIVFCPKTSCKYVYGTYYPAEYCDISLSKKYGFLGNATYAAGTDDSEGKRVFDAKFEALKPGTAEDFRLAYYANFKIPRSSDYMPCPACGKWDTIINAYETWERYNDSFGITVKARYRLEYDTQGGSAVSATSKDVADTSAAFTAAAAPTRSGYKFKGWNTQTDGNGKGTGTHYAAGDTVTLSWSEGLGSEANPVSQTLYAIWEEDVPALTYTVTYTDGVDGEEVFADDVHGNLQANASTPAFRGDVNTIRQNYNFMGWSPEVALTVTGDATYTATWERRPDTTTPGGEEGGTGGSEEGGTGDGGEGGTGGGGEGGTGGGGEGGTGGGGEGGTGGESGGPTAPDPSDIDAWYNGATGKWQLTLGEGEDKIKPYGKCKDHPDGILGGIIRGGVLTLVWADKDGNKLDTACHVERSTQLFW